MTQPRKEQTFLSYAHEDLSTVRKIYKALRKRNLNLWFDKEDMRPGEWEEQIEQAIYESKYFIICISDAAIQKIRNKAGVQGKELRLACNIAMNQAPSEFKIIPLRLEDCDRGDHRLSVYQQYDLFEDFEGTLNKLAVHLGGCSLKETIIKEEKSQDENLIEALSGKAEMAYYENDCENALALYQAITKINPDDAKAWYNKGVALGKSGRSEEAIAAYEKALAIDPDDADAWYNKGVALKKLNRNKEAQAAFKKARQLNPDL